MQSTYAGLEVWHRELLRLLQPVPPRTFRMGVAVFGREVAVELVWGPVKRVNQIRPNKDQKSKKGRPDASSRPPEQKD